MTDWVGHAPKNHMTLLFEPTLLLRWNGHKAWQKKGQREVLLYTNTLGPTSDESIWSFWTLVKAKRPGTHREEARADYNRTLNPLRRAPARRSCPPLVHTRDECGCFSCGRLSCAEKKRYDALGYKPPAGSQLTETRYAITACLESARRCESAPVVSSRSMGWVIPKLGKVDFESCRLVHGMCGFWTAWHRGLFLEGTWPELPSYCYGFKRARRRVCWRRDSSVDPISLAK